MSLTARRRSAIKLLAAACFAVVFICGTARAEITYQKSFGSFGSGNAATAGKFYETAGIAVNQASGDVYVVDRNNQRVQEFDGDGEFIRAWGFDVVASGVDDKPFGNESQEVKVTGTSGTFTLRYQSSTT